MRFIISLIFLTILQGCSNPEKIPDVSKIKIDLKTRRFEKELFSLDVNKPGMQLDELIARYPSFGENFINTILSSDPSWSADTVTQYVKGFITEYRPVFDTVSKVFSDFTPYENEIKKSLQLLHFYFPQYKTPRNIITYVGPLDGFADILSEDAFMIGLHAHLGKNFSGYKTATFRETYPEYISRRFEPEYISVNSMTNIVNDMYPEKQEGSLLSQMTEKGRRLYLLQKLLPEKKEFMLIGYSEQQMKECYAAENKIWDLFIQNNLLQSTDRNILRNYIGEGPKTQELGEGSPGNIGAFSGWQVVKEFMKKYPETTLQVLMETDAETIFEKAKYKP